MIYKRYTFILPLILHAFHPDLCVIDPVGLDPHRLQNDRISRTVDYPFTHFPIPNSVFREGDHHGSCHCPHHRVSSRPADGGHCLLAEPAEGPNRGLLRPGERQHDHPRRHLFLPGRGRWMMLPRSGSVPVIQLKSRHRC
jgi:hypothetical protein